MINWKGKIIIRLTFAVYIYFLIRILIFKGDCIIPSIISVFENRNLSWTDTNINFLPFKTILTYLAKGEFTRHILYNIFGNIAAFIPLGLITPFIYKKAGRLFIILLISFAASAFIEACQFLLSIGSADIDDLVLNTLGGVTGYIIFLLRKKYAYKKNMHELKISKE